MPRPARESAKDSSSAAQLASLDQSGVGEADRPGSTDYLDYLGDMILELHAMAQQAEQPTLAGILDVAYREAKLQACRLHLHR